MKQALRREREVRGEATDPVAVREDHAPPSALSSVVVDLAGELDRLGIRHAFLRGIDAHPHLPVGSDVDLCLRPRDLSELTRVLEGVCARRGVLIHERFHAGFLTQFHMVAVEEGERRVFLTLDVHTAEAVLGVPFLEAEEVLSDRRDVRGFRVPDEGVSALVDFLSSYLAGGEWKERHAVRLTAALQRNGSRVRALLGRFFGAEEAEALAADLRRGDRESARARYRSRRRRLLVRRFLRAPWRSLTSLAAFGYGVRVRPWWKPRGRFVVFLGTDGAGKTAVMEAVARELAPAFRAAESGTFHLRPGLIPQLDRVVHLGRRTQSEADWNRPHRAAPSGRLLSNLRVAWYALDYVIGYWVRTLPRRRRHALILFDRYFHDYLVDPRRCRVRPGTWLVRILVPRVPQPDTVIAVTAALETVQARKQELTPEESQRQLAAYEELSTRGGPYHVVRNDGPLEDTVQDVVRILFPAVERESTTPPYSLDRWYPAVRAAVSKFHVLGTEEIRDAGRAEARWAKVAPGEALAVSCVPRGDRSRLRRLGRRAEAARLAGRIDGAACVDRWYVFPGTGGSHVLLPANRAGFLAGLRLLPAGRRRWRWVRRILGALARLGLVGRLGLDELLVIVKGTAEPPRIPWIAAREGASVSVALGVPGLFRKAIVLVGDARDDAFGLLKISLTSAARHQVRHEAEILAWLRARGAAAVAAPALLAHGDDGDMAWLAQEFLDGRRSPDVFGGEHARFLAALHARDRCDVVLEEVGLFRDARARLERLAGTADPEWTSAMTALRDALAERFAGQHIPCGRSHGDFTPWNLVMRSGCVAAFDWEFSGARTPALFDLVHFQFQTGVLVRHVGADRLLDDLDEVMRGAGQQLARGLGLGPMDIDAQAGLYVLHVATFDEEKHRIERPPFVQVEWLYRARIDLARSLEERLRGGGAG